MIAGIPGGAAILSKNVLNNADTESWHFTGIIPGVNEDIWNIAEDNNGNVWLGSNNGIFKVSNFVNNNNVPALSNIKVERFGAAQGLSEGSIHVFNVAGKNYFVSVKGAFRYDEQQKKFIQDSIFGNIDLGNDPNEYNIVEDSKKRLWINFGKETELATPTADGKYKLDNTRFLAFIDKSIYSIFPENDSITWFACNEGLIKYNEYLDKNNKQSYKTLITSITAGETALNTGANNTVNVSVNYNNNALRFEYASPFFDQENKTQYQTWLESFEPTWSDFGSNDYKEYTNLPEGKYIFHVRAKNIYRKVSEEANYTFTVQPPWYRSWWAYMLYALAVLIALWLIIKWRVKVLNKEKILLEEKVAQRTHELLEEKSKVESTLATLTSTQAQLNTKRKNGEPWRTYRRHCTRNSKPAKLRE